MFPYGFGAFHTYDPCPISLRREKPLDALVIQKSEQTVGEKSSWTPKKDGHLPQMPGNFLLTWVPLL
jgi:hypothetical protein